MSTINRLMIVVSDKGWTLAAVHLACGIARRSGIEIVLLKMVPVLHPMDLGTPAGYLNFSAADADILEEMKATAEDYGICLSVQLFPYATYWSGIADAAEQLAVAAVMAQIPPSVIPYLRQMQQRWLCDRLAKQGQLFFTLDDQAPSVRWISSAALQNNIANTLEQRRVKETP